MLNLVTAVLLLKRRGSGTKVLFGVLDVIDRIGQIDSRLMFNIDQQITHGIGNMSSCLVPAGDGPQPGRTSQSL